MTSDAKSRARAAIERRTVDLIALSARLHANPETAWREHRACGWVAEQLSRHGFSVTDRYLLDGAIALAWTAIDRCAA